MFFVTYLRRELRRRMRQAIFIALGLALGVGLVVTVSAASAGTTKAESSVLSSLYGMGTDATVTGPPVPTGTRGEAKPGGPSATPSGISFSPNANGTEVCRYLGGPVEHGTCAEMQAGQSIVDVLGAPYSAFTSADVAAVARLHYVSAAAGGLLLSDNAQTISQFVAHPTGPLTPAPSFFFSVDGVDTSRLALSPLSAGTITSGHSFTDADADDDVAVVDSGYAASHHLTVGSAITVSNVPGVTGGRFTVIGIVRQPTATTPDDVYIPLARAQALGDDSGTAETGEVDMIYVTAASAADIPAVQHEIAALLPHDTVTTAASLASVVTGSVKSAASLAGDLGRWLAVLMLIAAFAVACLLTVAAVARRAAEFGMLKALGWRTRRIVAQVLGESLAIGIAGAAAGVGLGFAGVAVIAAVAPTSATVPGARAFSLAGGQAVPAGEVDPATASHVVAVALHPPVTGGVIVLAVVLAVAGGLLAGAFGAWRAARLRPATALALVA